MVYQDDLILDHCFQEANSCEVCLTRCLDFTHCQLVDNEYSVDSQNFTPVGVGRALEKILGHSSNYRSKAVSVLIIRSSLSRGTLVVSYSTPYKSGIDRRIVPDLGYDWSRWRSYVRCFLKISQAFSRYQSTSIVLEWRSWTFSLLRSIHCQIHLRLNPEFGGLFLPLFVLF